ncbi:nucleoside triphosphate pyrophosphohydrolase [Desulfurobacterium atlanticum]|uniref:Nucleoside triphosphate pyrophosphohydrolase n=1 Tax=Desulfurobacterium atlanticum TaxID=240169 RepID=A0A238XUY1_9BACT|nr:nucleoside triphosphate pyrophosphohydrolase [Desulfurobacterium atlanticum]SNR62747.1 tetrapyrrole methylase family protein / MazG family protein [Desulfurobacterium atlanticum]
MYTFEDLVKIMEKLRSDDGCPWDREQTHESLLPYLLEETYEFIDSVKSKDFKNMKEELGDILLQVVFHSQIAKEHSKFTIDEVVDEICRKLIFRHPHVFGERKDINSSEDVLKNWDEFKKAEGKHGDSILDGVPKSMPPIERALKLQKKAAKVGFDWKRKEQVMEKVEEEWNELKEAVKSENREKIEEELGDLLFAIVNLSRFLNVDPAIALHRTNQKFVKRFKEMERKAKIEGSSLEKMNLEEMDKLWESVKKEERDVNI